MDFFGNESSPSADSANVDDVMKLLGEMTEALDEFDTLMVDEAVEKMGKMHFPDNQKELFKKLKEAAETTDIELCSEIVEEWKKLI